MPKRHFVPRGYAREKLPNYLLKNRPHCRRRDRI